MSEEKKESKIEETKQEEEKQYKASDNHKEIFDLQNKYLRSLAEIENSRKRMQKEKSEAINFAIESSICEFLPAIDNFENALNFAKESSDEVKNWALGFQMILTQLKDILHDHSVVAFHSKGNLFDPHYHEAMEIIETDEYPDGYIIEEFAKGYKSASRVIRPAKVKVTRKKLQETEEKIIDTEDAKEDKTEEKTQTKNLKKNEVNHE